MSEIMWVAEQMLDLTKDERSFLNKLLRLQETSLEALNSIILEIYPQTEKEKRRKRFELMWTAEKLLDLTSSERSCLQKLLQLQDHSLERLKDIIREANSERDTEHIHTEEQETMMEFRRIRDEMEERLLALQKEMRERERSLHKEMDKLRASLQKEASDKEKLLCKERVALKDEIVGLSKQVCELQELLQQDYESKKKSSVVFSARLSRDVLPSNFNIKYDIVEVNTGDGYDRNTGIFTAPCTGVYAFSLVSNKKTIADVNTWIYKNGELSWSGNACCGCHVMKLEQHDAVHVKNTVLYIHANSRFSGHLLVKDESR